MLWEMISRFWKAGLTGAVILIMAGCGDGLSEVSELKETVADHEVYPSSKEDFRSAENIAEVYRDIYNEAAEANTLASLETKLRIVARLGENGYAAVDSENQVDMTGAEQVLEFCKAVEEKKNAALTIIVIKDFGFQKFDLETEGGNVNVVRGYYQYDQNGSLQNRSTISYPVDLWQYTQEGYLLFEGSYFSDENFVLTLSDTPEYTALRILPLDEMCRGFNRKYILPVGYKQNNIFLTDWSEEDFGDLNFYDVFDIFYSVLYRQPLPYVADENLGVGAVYRIPEEIFENVILTYMDIDKETLRQKTIYLSEEAAYEYRPRGFYEAEYSDIPYPEVVDYIVSSADEENPNGTITLVVDGVWADYNSDCAFTNTIVVQPFDDGTFRYLSNSIEQKELEVPQERT